MQIQADEYFEHLYFISYARFASFIIIYIKNILQLLKRITYLLNVMFMIIEGFDVENKSTNSCLFKTPFSTDLAYRKSGLLMSKYVV